MVLGAVVVVDPLPLLEDVVVDVAAAAMAAPPAARAAVVSTAMSIGLNLRMLFHLLVLSSEHHPAPACEKRRRGLRVGSGTWCVWLLIHVS